MVTNVKTIPYSPQEDLGPVLPALNQATGLAEVSFGLIFKKNFFKVLSRNSF